MKLNAKRLNHITVAVPAGEHDKVRAFYGGVLGLEEVPRPEALNKVYDLMWYKFLDILLHLDFSPPWVTPAENRHIALEVVDLPALRRYLEGQQATIREAVPMPDRDRFYLLDPFGNYFELMEMKTGGAEKNKRMECNQAYGIRIIRMEPGIAGWWRVENQMSCHAVIFPRNRPGGVEHRLQLF